MVDPDEPSPDEPALSAEEEAQQAAVLTREWIRIAMFATAGTLLLAAGLLVVTGSVPLFGSPGETSAIQWGAYVIVVGLAVGIAVWIWKYA